MLVCGGWSRAGRRQQAWCSAKPSLRYHSRLAAVQPVKTAGPCHASAHLPSLGAGPRLLEREQTPEEQGKRVDVGGGSGRLP